MTAGAWIALIIAAAVVLAVLVIVREVQHWREIRAEQALRRAAVSEAEAYRQVVHAHVGTYADGWAARLWKESQR